jgi:hypothetical protein
MDELDLGITCGREFHARQSFAACRSCILWIYQPLRPCLLLKRVIAKTAFEILLWYSSCDDLATFWNTRCPGGKANHIVSADEGAFACCSPNGSSAPPCLRHYSKLNSAKVLYSKGDLRILLLPSMLVGPRCRYKGVEVLHGTG